MPLRPCLGVEGQACGKPTARPDSRCSTCASRWHQRRDQARGNRHQRGYDRQHEQTRARLLPDAYGKPCPRCGQPMLPSQELDLGHPEDAPLRIDRTSRADRIEHATCNRGARD